MFGNWRCTVVIFSYDPYHAYGRPISIILIENNSIMTIEIHSPNLHVDERTIDIIKKKVVNLSHLGEKISRAEIFLTEDIALPEKNKICKIRLSIFGDDLFVSKNADSFGKAATAAIRILRRGLMKKQEVRNDLPEIVTSTIDI